MTAASPSPATASAVLEPPGRAEAPLVLDTAPPRTLGLRDQFALWANLGISLIGFTSATTVLNASDQPLSIAASATAIVLGTVIGTAMLAVAALIGARTGAPAMAVLRGLFGTRLSYLPTVLNVLQCVGWGIYELLVISTGAQTVVGTQGWHWAFALGAGVLTTVLTIWPLGSIAALRKYVAIAVAVTMVYLTVQLGRHHIPNPGRGNWHGFLSATDAIIAVSVSFVPLAADYTRHSRTVRSSFWGTFGGYTIAQVWCYGLGLIALLQSRGDVQNLLTSFTGVAAGWAFLLVLVLREADQSFANVYSTAMSLHNLFPRVDRRWLTGGIGVLVTVVATQINALADWYSNFLYLIGSVFVPLLAVLAVDFFLGGGRRRDWALDGHAPGRPLMLLPWALGFATYQFLSPTDIKGWSSIWTGLQSLVHFTPQEWTSASLFSFLVAGLATLALTKALPKA
ncbi:purine-cytosine permease family protein [Kitasatospora viridis]|uniref:Putative hydroxymethylpyrimidine transporter CytX n=1 Tax=Kitasatospora viridis TaxID=281105 RepID=A0A561UHY2_9ACTN|nr:cytosine permease [Kitasatospora viridis]TWF98979.1 putative hydroxymethylpyrimidine transporter CytX [Kitasatospora viridis]